MKRKIFRFPKKKSVRKKIPGIRGKRQRALSIEDLQHGVRWNGAMLNLLERALRYQNISNESMLRELTNALEVNLRRVEEHKPHASKAFRDKISPRLGKIIASLSQSISKNRPAEAAIAGLEILIRAIQEDIDKSTIMLDEIQGNKMLKKMQRKAA